MGLIIIAIKEMIFAEIKIRNGRILTHRVLIAMLILIELILVWKNHGNYYNLEYFDSIILNVSPKITFQ